MSDVFTREKRSEVMALIKSKNSQAELITFRYLRSQNIYFQKHYKRAIGTPDLALPSKKRAVFIDGDFWHGRTLAELIEKRGEADYWTKKIKRNKERDEEVRAKLCSQGWQVLAVWESDVKRKRTRSESLIQISDFLQK